MFWVKLGKLIRTRLHLVGFALFGAFFLVSFIRGFVAGYRDSQARADKARLNAATPGTAVTSSPFTGKLEPFLSTPKKRASKDARRTLKGKVLALDYPHKAIDPLQDELPAELDAETPEEVGTVVWLFWGTERVADDRARNGVLISVCEVVVIDVPGSEILAQRKFRGTPPSQADAEGPKPMRAVLDFLEQLRDKT